MRNGERRREHHPTSILPSSAEGRIRLRRKRGEEVRERLFLLAGERERHLLLLGIEEGDLEGVGFAELEVAAGAGLAAELGDVDEPCDAFLNGSERAMLVELNDHAFHDVIFLVLGGGLNPRVWLQCLYRERDLAFLYLDDLHAHFVRYFVELARVLNERPVDFGDVHESFEAVFELHECTEVYESGHVAVVFIADGVLADDFLAFLLGRALLGEDKLAFFRNRGNNRHLQFFTDEFLKLIEYLVFVAVWHARIVVGLELRGGEESGNALPFEDKTALVRFLHSKLEYFLLAYRGLGVVPDEGLTSLFE